MSFFSFHPFSKNSDRLLHLGIIGLGRISDIHIRTFAHNKNVSIESLVDIRRNVVGQKASLLGIKKFSTDYRSILRDPSIDAVDILLPHHLHATCIIEALESGKHVICEKPLALSLPDIDRIKRVSQKTKKYVHVKHYFRYARFHRQLKDVLTNEGIGKPYLVHCLYTTSSIDHYNDPMSWKGDRRKAGGGVLIDTGFHMVDLLQYLFGSPISVYGVGKRNFSPFFRKGEDLSVTVLEYPHNMVATLTCTSADTSLGNRWEKRFFGSNGSIHIADHGRDKMISEFWKNDHVVRVEDERNWWDNANSSALNDCIDRIIADRPPAVSLAESRTVLQTILLAYQSSQEGKKLLFSNQSHHHARVG